ncbi:MAG: DUF58 domain-containing protein [Candidatus Omnitrophica bacterium]|nr:DUF58 domain-containing protein [Candidatus Omnitrophota bacterium]MDD5771161.1 DUF58 domain-containing protein [Candidatus Omnitrophota bacterium]
MYRKFLGKWILFLILLGFSLFMSLKTPYVIFSFFFWTILSILITSFLWLVLVYLFKKLHLERKITLKIEEDDTLDISLNIKNRSFLPVFDVILEDHLDCAQGQERQKFIMPDLLMPNSTATLNYHCVCPLRGKYRVGPIFAYFFDPLGLFYFKKTYSVYSEVYVYPRTFKIHRFPALNRGTSPWMGVETSRVSGDDDEFFGVREYKRGDPLKKIHWMVSARKNQLIVKEFQRQSFFRATILFNLEKEDNFGEGKESVEEYTIKIVASIARYLTNLGVSIEIISHAGEVVHIPFNKGEDHLEEILKFLTVAQAESRITLPELFATFQRNILEDSSLIVVMTDRNKAFLPAMLSLGVRNVSIVPVFLKSLTFLKDDFSQRNTKDDNAGISEHMGINPIYIACRDNLEEKF